MPARPEGMAAPLTGVVLAGGRSRRLGRNKAFLPFGGRPLLHIVCERVAQVCPQVVVATSARGMPGEAPTGVEVVRDEKPGQGPLAGMQAGLRAAAFDYAFVLACDMPFLSPSLLQYMADLPRDYQALVPEWQGRRHPLHAIYSRTCLPVIDYLLDEGQKSVGELLAQVNVRLLPEGEIRPRDAAGLSLFNLNDAQDLKEAQRRWRLGWTSPLASD